MNSVSLLPQTTPLLTTPSLGFYNSQSPEVPVQKQKLRFFHERERQRKTERARENKCMREKTWTQMRKLEYSKRKKVERKSERMCDINLCAPFQTLPPALGLLNTMSHFNATKWMHHKHEQDKLQCLPSFPSQFLSISRAVFCWGFHFISNCH